MRFILELLSLVAEGLLLFGLGAWIGLWWLPDIARGNLNASLATATVALIAGGNYYTRHVVSARHRGLPIRFSTYTALAGLAISGYLYGVFFKWL
jgi:hypothetical protein